MFCSRSSGVRRFNKTVCHSLSFSGRVLWLTDSSREGVMSNTRLSTWGQTATLKCRVCVVTCWKKKLNVNLGWMWSCCLFSALHNYPDPWLIISLMMLWILHWCCSIITFLGLCEICFIFYQTSEFSRAGTINRWILNREMILRFSECVTILSRIGSELSLW